MTHRQFLGWMAWLEIDDERPGKTEMYLMQIAREIRCVPYAFSDKSDSEVDINQFRLVKKRGDRTADEVSEEDDQEKSVGQPMGGFALAQPPSEATAEQVAAQRIRQSAFGNVGLSHSIEALQLTKQS